MFGYYIKELEKEIEELENSLELIEQETEYYKDEKDSINEYLTSKHNIRCNKILAVINSSLSIMMFNMIYYLSLFSPLIFNIALVFFSGLMISVIYKDIIKASKLLKNKYSDYLKLNKTEIMDMLNNFEQKENICNKKIADIYNDIERCNRSLNEAKKYKDGLENTVNAPYLHADTKEEYELLIASQDDNLKVLKDFLIDSREYSSIGYNQVGYKQRPKQIIKKM